MIPLPALSAIPWKLVGWVAVALVVAVAGWRVSAWHAAYEALPSLKARLEAEEGCLEGSKCWTRQRELQEAVGREQVRVVAAYETEIAGLRDARPLSVRVCDRSGLSVSRPAGGTGSAGAAAPGILPAEAAGDREIGPALADLAFEADTLLARCRGLTQWTVALATSPEK